MRKSFIIFILCVIFVVIYYLFYPINRKISAPSLKFMDKHIILGSAVSDSLYSFNTVIENHSSSIKKYYLSSTCGCTVISYDVKKLSPKMTDTIEVIINTYGKKHNFSSNLFLFNENHVLLDTMLIDVKGF